MGTASTSSLYERGQIEVLSTTGYTVKRIADVARIFMRCAWEKQLFTSLQK
uniref:DNA-directed RNA polymerase n=1 Tax=Heterorhabditis bacteriophora TaxID=37862 RepID=A0A1I7X287_HETBA